MNTSPQPEVLTVRELQKMLKLGRNKTYELLRSKEIPSIRIGRQIRIRNIDITSYLNTNK
jgi:excisionase family DNA binding protein